MDISNVAHSSNWANTADWEQNKNIITQLYAENTLPKVMEIMESQGFKATYALKCHSESAAADLL